MIADCFAMLLRELVADLTMADGGTLSLPTSLTASYCHELARTLLGTWLHDTDNSYVLEQVSFYEFPATSTH